MRDLIVVIYITSHKIEFNLSQLQVDELLNWYGAVDNTYVHVIASPRGIYHFSRKDVGLIKVVEH